MAKKTMGRPKGSKNGMQPSHGITKSDLYLQGYNAGFHAAANLRKV